MANLMSITLNNNILCNEAIIQTMHKTMERLYYAAKELKGITGRGHKSAIAKLLNVSPYAMTNWEKRGMSSDAMIQAEIVFGCAASWLETGKGDIIRRLSDDKTNKKVPLLSWDQIRIWINALDRLKSVKIEKWMLCPDDYGERSFCLKIEGISMTNPHGGQSFTENDVILIDPDAECRHECFVVVNPSPAEPPIFRQLILDSGKRYLKALNPAWPEQIVEMRDDAIICGVAVLKTTSLL